MWHITMNVEKSSQEIVNLQIQFHLTGRCRNDKYNYCISIEHSSAETGKFQTSNKFPTHMGLIRGPCLSLGGDKLHLNTNASHSPQCMWVGSDHVLEWHQQSQLSCRGSESLHARNVKEWNCYISVENRQVTHLSNRKISISSQTEWSLQRSLILAI